MNRAQFGRADIAGLGSSCRPFLPGKAILPGGPSGPAKVMDNGR
jgi:hypothetical protein